MTAANENQSPVQIEEANDRLLDISLSEVHGGTAHSARS